MKLLGLLKRGKPFLRRLKSGKTVKVKGLPIQKEQVIQSIPASQKFIDEYGDSAIGQLLIQRKLPPKRLILKDIREDPTRIHKTIKAYAFATGKSTREVYDALLKSGYLGVGKDLAVNIGGLIGSIAGGNAGLPGALAGDLIGAATTRRFLNRTEVLSLVDKLGGTSAQKKRNYRLLMRKMKAQMPEEDRKDLIGWAVGNTVATTVPLPVPLKGGAVASITAGPIKKGIDKRSVKAYWEEQKAQLTKIKDLVTGEAERKFRRRIDAQLDKNLPRFRREMFIGLIEFNKLVSLKGFTRLVKGKRIRVKAHNRRVKVSVDLTGDLPSPPMRPKVRPGSLSGFKTAKGSTYIVGPSVFGKDLMSTMRYKTKHPGHPDKDIGWRKTPSQVTLFIPEEKAKEIGRWQSLQAESKRIYVTDKEVLLTSNNLLTGKRGLDGRIPFSKNFKTGTAPLELDNFASDQKLDKYGLSDGWFKGNHPGNSITEVEYK